ncbi:LutC/YkgG family protein [Actomonas aquatica]|uniref:LUD domain-containing protein n=1 Tax=Actomonas aquatica TaxID=2866162 RepID=A0ABZ1C8C5_9BACT|nr:LUD domain-containing protein [Opitutus sp. WL0086]WRQ87635.1 LUD domain-containing protein [Opitutus sp. WL0086]
MSSARDQILKRVNDALAPLPERAPLPDWDRELVHVRETAIPPSTDLWALFSERLKSVNGEPVDDLATLVNLLRENGWLHGYCDPALWPELQSAFDESFTVETDFDRTRVDDYAFGITAVAGAIAETGTLILGDNTTSSRLGALTPWAHIAVVRDAQIHPDILAAINALPEDPNLIFVTGPSKTADVEGILIEGVHGPGRQLALRR